MAKLQSRTAPRSYRNRLATKRSDELFVKIIQKLSVEKLYRDPKYTSQQLATDLGTDTRYIAAAVAAHTDGGNFRTLINNLKLREACRMLRSPKFLGYSVEEIGLTSGFASRQAFYLAFHRAYHTTPKSYRQKAMEMAKDGGCAEDILWAE